ncbi:hypothetical protein [Polyangium spumosum]|uniref:Uncharacterized protein n=1 Tax=Polyangium spumosum TaxID=889282 RepID=A0A6N7PPX2_9BACT|nr:hypothetical protein [Polyangium spumosum]MRG93989.1 hypothetical protein [Polyangium spumosum]
MAMIRAAASPRAAQEEASTSRARGPSSLGVVSRTRYRPASSRVTSAETSSGSACEPRPPSSRSTSAETTSAVGQPSGADQRRRRLLVACASAVKASDTRAARIEGRAQARGMGSTCGIMPRE